jgi:hypothetical protein
MVGSPHLENFPDDKLIPLLIKVQAVPLQFGLAMMDK